MLEISLIFVCKINMCLNVEERREHYIAISSWDVKYAQATF